MRSYTLKIKQLTTFGILAAVILSSQIVFFGLPGVQLNGLFISAITLTYRWRALIPIYVYVLLYLLYYGFLTWNLPYLYIWLPLWGIFMLCGKLPLPPKVKVPLHMFLCGIYGLSFGILYAPFQALTFGWNFEQTLVWVKAGFLLPPYSDITHGINNFATGMLILPLSNLLTKLDRN
ncbi:MAG: hypothetical protein FWG83_00675 [Oscillospiraceae bacterium]|nr:hypothetical protein [Oscillospiraceae bacterium]